jgi:dipeptidyl aminopeptidase/acylaminoacyl peptidase
MRILAAIAVWLFALPAVAQTLSAEVFGRIPEVQAVSISPDGRRLALARNSLNAGAAVMIMDLDNTANQDGYRVGEELKLRDVRWVDNTRVSYLVNQTVRPDAVLPRGYSFRGQPRRVDYWRHGVINTQTGEARIMVANTGEPWWDTGSHFIAPILGDDGYARMIGASSDVQTASNALYRINMDTAHVRNFWPAGTNRDTTDYVLNQRGDVVARLDADRETNRWRMFVYDGTTPRLLLEDVSETGQPIDVSGLLPDGRIVVQHDDDGGYSGLYVIDQRTGEMTPLFKRDNAEVLSAISDPWTREIVGVSWTDGEVRTEYFQADLQTAREALHARAPDAAMTIESWSQDRSRFVVFIEQGLDGGGYYLFEPAINNLRFIAARYPELRQTQVGQRQSITYRARDGTRVPAILTLPNVPEQRNLPVVLLVHGGPHGVFDTLDFDWWAAFLSARGYAVLQPNFRGSGGYGKAWEDAGHRQWGGLMQTDVEDGVAALVRSGIADASRVCIVGASYGGYAALAGATLTPDRYRCAVSVAGLSDLPAFIQLRITQTGGADSGTVDFWRASIGDRDQDREAIRAVSPALLADRVRIPVLLMHGTNDTVVPIDQSRRMERALRAAGKDVRFVELRGDDHWLSDPATRIQMLQELDTFLGQNLRSGGQ